MGAGDSLIVIERAPSTALAEELQSLLATEGIKSFLDPYSAEEVVAGELYTEFTGVDVKVRDSDAGRAREVLAQSHRAGRVLKDLYDAKDRRESASQTRAATRMTGFSTNIEQKTRENASFRQVLYTAPHSQLVVMTLQPGEDIGLEKHEHGDQFIRVESGKGEAIIDRKSYPLSDGVAVIIPAGSMHNVVNSSKTEPMRLYTIYSPPEHPDGTIHRTRRDAVESEKAAHH